MYVHGYCVRVPVFGGVCCSSPSWHSLKGLALHFVHSAFFPLLSIFFFTLFLFLFPLRLLLRWVFAVWHNHTASLLCLHISCCDSFYLHISKNRFCLDSLCRSFTKMICYPLCACRVNLNVSSFMFLVYSACGCYKALWQYAPIKHTHICHLVSQVEHTVQYYLTTFLYLTRYHWLGIICYPFLCDPLKTL